MDTGRLQRRARANDPRRRRRRIRAIRLRIEGERSLFHERLKIRFSKLLHGIASRNSIRIAMYPSPSSEFRQDRREPSNYDRLAARKLLRKDVDEMRKSLSRAKDQPAEPKKPGLY